MAKVYGIQGNLTGKIANTIYAVVKGVNVARAYNPEPANPQTSGQIESRAKLKLLSQMAKSLAPLIAFRAEGLVSSRNLFTKANYDNVAYENDVASLQMSDVDLTGSVVSLGKITASVTENKLVTTVYDIAEGVKSVFFGAVAVGAQGLIHVFPVQIVNFDPAHPNTYTSDEVDVEGWDNVNVFAYGIRFNDENEFAKYTSLLVSAAGSASLNVLRKLDPSSYTVTETLHHQVGE